jgi:hypothetical protein
MVTDMNRIYDILISNQRYNQKSLTKNNKEYSRKF